MSSSSILPASILDRSRISFSNPSSDFARRTDGLQIPALFAGQFGGQGQFGHADDGVHRSADLVAQIGQELALETAVGFRRFLGRPQQVFGLAPSRDVVADGDPALELARGVLHRNQIALDPKRAAVLAVEHQILRHFPPFRRGPADTRGPPADRCWAQTAGRHTACRRLSDGA